MATLSASAPFPTVTLDLTHNNHINNINNNHHPYYPFQFQIRPPQPQTTPFHQPQLHHTNNNDASSKFSGLHLSQDHRPTTTHQPASLAAAITADPNFKAVLAAAISSIIGGGGGPNPNPDGNGNGNGGGNPNILNSSTVSGFSGN